MITIKQITVLLVGASALSAILFGVIYGVVHGMKHAESSDIILASESLHLLASSDTLCPFNKDHHLVNASECLERGCVWDTDKVPASLNKRPRCFNPKVTRSRYIIETIDELPNGETRLLLKLLEESPEMSPEKSPELFPPNLKKNLDVQFIHLGDSILRVKITASNESRYEVPIQFNLPKSEPSVDLNSKLNFSFIEPTSKDNFAIRIWRKETGTILFDTSIGGFTFADQFLQVSTHLPSPNLYGLGENSHYTFKHDMNYKTWPMFARDQGPQPGEYNLYGSHPVYYVVEQDGNSHAVFWLNSNAMEAETLPTPGLTLRAIGGIIDLFIMAGPSPSETVRQYTSLIGKPFMPPYWALGFQLCRYGNSNLDAMKAAMLRTRRNGIPQDVQYADIDHMQDRKVFTIDWKSFQDLPQFVKEEKKQGTKFIVILDPAINAELSPADYPVHQRALSNDIYIKWSNRSFVPENNFGAEDYMLGYVWPRNRTAFPDWFKMRTSFWWGNEIKLFYDEINFDGLWIDMNEPTNFGTNMKMPWNWENNMEPWSLQCPISKWDDPPYTTKAARIDGDFRLSDKTICMVGVQGENGKYLHYDVHNLYGLSQLESTLDGLRNVTNKRGLVVTRSTFPSSGKWGGHWLGDNTARWEDLKASITGMLEFNMFGIPYVGADICGFFENTTEELCHRWMQLGAFYPFSRNHNSIGFIDQDPGIWPSVAATSRKFLRLRYLLLPFLYSLHHESSQMGSTVVTPLLFEFPNEKETLSIDDQFLWGHSLMFAPIVSKGAQSRDIYFPKGASWYDLNQGNLIQATGKINVTLTSLEIGVYVRGGSILPTQRPAANTEIARKKPFGLIIAPDVNGSAEGSLFWDDGDSIDTVQSGKFYSAKFNFSSNTLYWHIEHQYNLVIENLTFSDLTIFNVSSRPLTILKNGIRLEEGDFHYNAIKQVLEIFDLNIHINENFNLSWSDSMNFKLPCPVPYKDGYNDSEPIGKKLCLKACVWDSLNEKVPCQIPPPNEYGYAIKGAKVTTANGMQVSLTRLEGPSMFENDSQNLEFQAFMYSDSLLRFRFVDSSAKRYEVPIELNLTLPEVASPLYEMLLVTEDIGKPFAFRLKRRLNGNNLIDTSVGGLTFSDQFISITFLLPSKNVYGLGENNHATFRHDMKSKTWPIFNRDQPPLSQENLEMNLYGAHPFFQVQENDGNSFGVFLLNSNAIDYQLLDYPAITFRTIGGILDFFVMLGPTPENVVSAYTSLIGRPMMPPYWSLGFQICRYGYKNTDHIMDVINRTRYYEIPQDVQYADVDYMDRRMDFTLDKINFGDLPQLNKELRRNSVRVIAILDPAINAEMPADDYETHSRATAADVYIKWPEDTSQKIKNYNNNGKGDVMLGYVWPDNRTAFPSWLKNSTHSWWKEEILLFHNKTMNFDGLWIDMNEPAVFDTNMERPWNWPVGRDSWNLKCPSNKLDDPPYVTKAASLGPSFRMSDKTLCMIAKEETFPHYDVHNLYGYMQTPSSLRAMQEATGERSIVVTRSTFAGSGKWAGHWLGDNEAVWVDMHRSIIGMLEFNLFGIPYVGADICGFFGNTTEELCQRWMQLGAFYPYARNHNGKDYLDQDPGMWPTVGRSSKKVLDIRYSLLPYLYTLFYQARIQGGTVVRPLHHEFQHDRQTFGIDTQFMWGSALLISPVLEPGAISKQIYFPIDFWYDFETGSPIEFPGEEITVAAPLDVIPLHVRGGHIIVKQIPSTNTEKSRLNPFQVLVALGMDRKATGILFWDDGNSIDTIENDKYDLVTFIFEQDTLTSHINITAGNLNSLTVSEITFFGIESRPKNVSVQGSSLPLSQEHIEYNVDSLRLSLVVDINISKKFSVKLEELWSH